MGSEELRWKLGQNSRVGHRKAVGPITVRAQRETMRRSTAEQLGAAADAAEAAEGGLGLWREGVGRRPVITTSHYSVA